MGEAERKKQNLPASSSDPVTLIGLLLQASMLRWEEERVSRYLEVKQAGSKDGNSVTLAAFRMAVNHLFKPETDLREISEFIAGVRDEFGDVISWMEMEALIRNELGENVDIDDVEMSTVMVSATLVLLGAARRWNWDKGRIDLLLREAEKSAWREGHRPTLAAR
jgi:hypothetical protein